MGNIVKFGDAPVWVEDFVSFFEAPISEGFGVVPPGMLNTWVGAFCVLDGSGGLEIGQHTVISPGVHIYTHVNDLPLKGAERPVVKKPTKIGSHVYLGPGVVVSAGVTLGNHVVVGANSVILKDAQIPDYAMVAGSPATIRRMMNEDETL